MYKNNIEIIAKEKTFCPFCEKEHITEKHRQENIATAQNSKIVFLREYYVCSEQGKETEFETAEMMSENLQRVRAAYRKIIIKKE